MLKQLVLLPLKLFTTLVTLAAAAVILAVCAPVIVLHFITSLIIKYA